MAAEWGRLDRLRHPTFTDGLPDEPTAAKALAHPMRRMLLDVLSARGLLSSKELAKIVGADVQSVNHHLRTLREARFIEVAEATRHRNVIEHIYRVLLEARVEVWPSTARRTEF